ncbi:MAG: glycosyltransferase [Gemmatimonadales bacterium]|nr:glycosyltransferase [Gemmatimonadales bacterium]
MRVVILGLSITSSWGNGHATTFRGLVRELAARGHDVLFLERDVPWYAAHRDLPNPPYGRTGLYGSVDELRRIFGEEIEAADLVIVGSFVPEGAEIGEWVLQTTSGIAAFYDLDTPVTLAAMAQGERRYLTPELIPRYRLYLSFTGGPTLQRLEAGYGSPMARPLYCSVDPTIYRPIERALQWDLGYMGTYSSDRQAILEGLLLEPARRWSTGRFIVAGPQYPATAQWPANVARAEHVSPGEHRAFYGAQRFTLNLTRVEMVEAGYSPSTRLFEAAACGVPIISDWWAGLDEVFEPGLEILIARSSEEVLTILLEMSEAERERIGARSRTRVLKNHTAAHRARELEGYALALLAREPATS